jgi:hypothetical protein
MRATDRQVKFNEFQKLIQDGNLNPIEIAKHLGIAMNTVYNWRKKLRLETQSAQQIAAEKAQPSFSRVVVSPIPEISRSSFIEIVIGNNIVFRIPDQSPQATLQTILDSITHWKFER